MKPVNSAAQTSNVVVLFHNALARSAAWDKAKDAALANDSTAFDEAMEEFRRLG